MTAFLATNPHSTTPQARRYDFDGTAATFGATVSASPADPAYSTRDTMVQRIVQIGGARTLIQFVGPRVRRSTDGGASWSDASADFSALANPMDTAAAFRGGPYVTCAGGV